MEMAAEDSLDPQPMMEEPAHVERQAPLHPRGYTHLLRMEVQWYVTRNMAVFADGVEVRFPEHLPQRSGADVLPLGAPTRYNIPVPMTPTASFQTQNNPPAPPRVRRNVYVPPEQREEGAPLFQDVVVDEDDDNDNGRSSSEFEENYDTPDESEDDVTQRR
ncbi:hypothetical protein H0H92_006872 [Tricholoma furcatifolium]|nr:hypothetical protein H0H92_006872 [Tricholoma furcatifolium]